MQPLYQSSLTISFWLKVLTFNQALIFRVTSSFHIHQELSLLLNSNGTVSGKLSSDMKQITSLISLENSKWTFITASFILDAYTNSIFLSFDQSLVASQSWSSSFSEEFFSLDNLVIGDSQAFDRQISDFQISSPGHQQKCKI